MSSPAEANIEKQTQFFKALGHPARLLIMNLIKSKPRHGEELALILMLNPATVSHHLSILVKAGLLKSKKEQYYQVYSMEGSLLKNTLAEMIFFPPWDIAENVEEDAYRQKVLRTFLRRGRLVGIPAQRKKRQIILEEIIEQFEPEKEYLERKVNIILLDFHDDVATLRRGLIEFGLMERTTNGIYKRKYEMSETQSRQP
jgi:ArsR family transcriptional regulator